MESESAAGVPMSTNAVSELDLDADADKVSDELLKKMFRRAISVKVLVEIMGYLANARNGMFRVYQVTLRNLLADQKYYPDYPVEELDLTAEFWGRMLQHDLLPKSPENMVKEALRCILVGLRSPPGSNMQRFGLKALEQFRSRMADFPEILTLLRQSQPVERPKKSNSAPSASAPDALNSARSPAASSGKDLAPSFGVYPGALQAGHIGGAIAWPQFKGGALDKVPAAGLVVPLWALAWPHPALAHAMPQAHAGGIRHDAKGMVKSGAAVETPPRGKVRLGGREGKDADSSLKVSQKSQRASDDKKKPQRQSPSNPSFAQAVPPGQWAHQDLAPSVAKTKKKGGNSAGKKARDTSEVMLDETRGDSSALDRAPPRRNHNTNQHLQSQMQSQAAGQVLGWSRFHRSQFSPPVFVDIEEDSLVFTLSDGDIEAPESTSKLKENDETDEYDDEVALHRPWEPRDVSVSLNSVDTPRDTRTHLV